MDAGLLADGIVLGAAGAILLALIFFYPEKTRREKTTGPEPYQSSPRRRFAGSLQVRKGPG